MNRDRDFFVDRSTAALVLAACPDHDWRAVFALARFAGMRPCEIGTRTWGEILWDVGKIRVDSPKTGLRFVPLFPELVPILRDAFDAAEPGTVHLTRYRADTSLGTRLNKIIQRAGLKPWPKTFVNLRATRRTELEKQHKHHVVNAWMGHGSTVAAKHYLQVTERHHGTSRTTKNQR